jgi:hypothetical protein
MEFIWKMSIIEGDLKRRAHLGQCGTALEDHINRVFGRVAHENTEGLHLFL